MDRFPQELVDHICGHLGSEDLRTAYDVSLKFRNAAEEHAGKFRHDEYEITEETKQHFIRHYSGFRLRYLQRVIFYVNFPDLIIDEKNGCRESVEEQREKDRIFTEQINDLFATLKIVEVRAGTRNYGRYKLTIYSPTQKRVSHMTEDRYPCLHREHEYWRIHLREPEVLPDIMSVVTFKLDDDQHSEYSCAKLDYRILIDLAAHFTNLEDLQLLTGRDEWTPDFISDDRKQFLWDYDGPRRDTRHDLSKAVTTSKLSKSLQRITLNFFCKEIMREATERDQRKPMPNLVSPFSKDPFSSSLRMLSYGLRELTLQVQADETLFWPSDGSIPTWPHIERISIMFHMVSPSGAWYFEGPRGEGRELAGYEISDSSYPPLEATEENEWEDGAAADRDRYFDDEMEFSFRVAPNDTILGPFLTNFAKAASNMPKLRQAILWSPLRWEIDREDEESAERALLGYFDPPAEYRSEPSFAWGFGYYAPGAISPLSSEPAEYFEPRTGWLRCKTRTIWWKVGDWRPSSEVHSLFQGIGHQEHGDALSEEWGRTVSREIWAYEHWMPERRYSDE